MVHVSHLGDRQQRRVRRELERKMAELDRLDRIHGLGAMPTHAMVGSPRRTRRRALALLLVLALGGAFALTSAPVRDSLRSFVSGPGRLGSVPDVAHGKGPFAFMAHQQRSEDPVSYDPCHALHVEVNPRGAPADYLSLVQTAMDHTAAATGFRFEYDGPTDDLVTDDRSIDPGSDAPPVLVAWTSSDEISDLGGDVAGLGGSVWVETRPGLRQYVTGVVALDVAEFATIGLREDARAEEQAIIDHEFGHLVGLAHVRDDGELMNDDNVGRTTYGPGDREGLAALGSTPCR